MSKDEIFGILVVVLSILFAILGFHLGIETLQSLSTFSAGAFTTYVVQHRLQIESEKRKMRAHMRDTIYGPIFKEVSKILESVKLVQYIDSTILENLKGVMTHYLFFTIRQDLKSKLSDLLNRVEKYDTIRHATKTMLQDVIRKETEKAYHVDVGSNPMTIILRLLIGQIAFAFITLHQTLFQGIAPRDFVRTETQKWGENISIEVTIGGKSKNLSDFESLYKLVLREIEKQFLYVEEKKQRVRLIGKLEAFLEQIKVFVNLE